jgi:phenylacetic acid degradation protein
LGSYSFDGVVPVVDRSAFVHPDAVLIGDVVVEAGCYIGPFASLRGDFGQVRIGAGANVQDGCVLHAYPDAAVVVAPGAHVGHGATLHGCSIESGAFIGIGSIVLDGAVIGERAMLGAGTFIKAGFRVPPGQLAMGMPGRIIRELTEEELAWAAGGPRIYSALAERSLATMRPVEPLAEIEPDRPRVRPIAGSSIPLNERRARN